MVVLKRIKSVLFLISRFSQTFWKVCSLSLTEVDRSITKQKNYFQYYHMLRTANLTDMHSSNEMFASDSELTKCMAQILVILLCSINISRYEGGFKIFWPDIKKPHQIEKAARDI